MAEEFKVKIGAELDDSSFDSLKNKISSAKLNPIKLTVDDREATTKLNNISQQINNLQTNPIQLRMNDRTVLNQLANIRQQIQALGNITINLGGGNRGIGNTTTALQRAYREVYNLYNQIESMELKLNKLRMSGIDAGNITQYQQQLNALRTTYQQLLNTLGSNNVNLDIVFTDIDRSRTAISQLSSAVDNARTTLARDIKINIDNGDLEGKISAIEQRFNSLNVANNNVTTGITTLRALLNTMDASNDIQSVTNDYMVFKQVLETVTNQVDELQRQQKQQQRQQRQTNDIAKLDIDRNALSSKMDVWLHDNSAAAKQFGNQIQSLKSQLVGCDRVQLNGIKAEFEQIKREAQLAGKATLSFGDSFKAQLSKLGTYFSASMLITESIRAMKEMYNNVVEVDTAMTGLYRVTDLTATQYDMLYDKMVVSAKEYGSTLSDMITSTADWVRLGFDSSTANQLAEVTAMYQHISDLDNKTAVENLVTAYKGFQDQLLTLYNGDSAAAVEYVADIFNELGNNYAVSAEQVGTALTKCASALDLAGNSIQESAAMATGITEVTQDAEKAGSSLKVLSLRLRGMKGELEELGEETDENVESLSKMQTQVLNLTDGKVNIFEDDGSFKSTYEIMDGIAEIYDKLDPTKQADLLETIAGKNRANDVAALIQNWEQVEAAMQSALGAEGSAAAENAKYMESIQGRLDTLKASWQALSNTAIDSDFVKTLVSGLTDVVDLLDNVINTLGSFGTIGAGLAIFNIFKNKDLTSNIGNFAKALFDSSTSFDAFDSAATAAGKSIKSFMTSASGIATAIGLITTVISTGIQIYRNYKQELREGWATQQQNGEVALDEANNITELYNAYQKANAAYANNSGSKESLESATNSLLTALGYETSEINTLIGKYGELSDAINQVTLDELISKRTEINEGYTGTLNTLLDKTSEGYFTGSYGMISSGKDEKLGTVFTDLLEKAGLISQSSNGATGGFALLLGNAGATDSLEDVIALYDDIIAMQEVLQGGIDQGLYSKDDLLGSNIWNALNNKLADFKKEYQSTIDYVNQLNENEAQIQIMSFASENDLPTTTAEFDAFKQSMIDTALASGQFVGSQKLIEDSINNTIESIPAFTKFFKTSAEEVQKYTEEQKQAVIDSFGNTTGKALTQSAKDAYQEYKEIIDEMSQLGVDPSQTIFGNIDTNNRQVLEWTEENLAKYKDILESWHPDMSWGEIVDDYFGTISTVLGTSKNYDGVEIAFTPMLQTENGAVILDDNTIDKYISGLIGKAGEGWTNEDLFKLDAEGLEVDGQRIKGLIADIGDTSIKTQEAMHFTGKDGALAGSFKMIEEEAKQVDVSVNELLNSLSNNNEIQNWFNKLSSDKKDFVYEIGVKSDDTGFWTLDRWQQELNHISEYGMTSQESLQSFYDTLNNTEDGSFSDNINSHIEKIQTLQEALAKINSGELTDSDKLDLAMSFPELIGKTNDVNTLKYAISGLIDKTNQGLDESFTSQIEALGGAGTSAGKALLALQAMIKGITDTDWDFDIDAEIEKFNKLYDARKESVSGTGLSSEAIKAVDAMFSSLEGYDASVLFERTEHGIHLNTSALRALQSQYESTTKLDIQKRLQDLKQEYNDSAKAVEGLTKGTEEYNKALADRGLRDTDAILEDIRNVQTLAAQYEGLTSAYNKWILAQSSGEEGDMYDNITGSLENIKQLYEDGLVGTNAFRSAVQMMTDEDLSTANIEKLLSVYEAGYPTMERYFTDGQKGCEQFLKDVQSLGKGWAELNSDGNWEINFGIGNDAEVAQVLSDMMGLQISAEQVQIIMRKLSDYGFDINLDSAYASVEELQSRIEETEAKLKELGQEPVDINIYCDASDLDAEIEKAKAKIAEINNSNISPEVKTAQLDDANAKLDILISKKIEASQPAFMSIDISSVNASIAEALSLLQEYQTSVNNLTALEIKGADTSAIESAKSKVDELAGKIQALDSDTKINIGLEADGSINSIKEQISNNEVKINVTADTTQATTDIASIEGNDITVDVTTSGNEAIDMLKSAIDGIQDKDITITANVVGKDSVDNLSDSVNNLNSKTVIASAVPIGKTGVDNLSKSIESLTDKTITATANVVGTNLVNALKEAIDSLYDKTVSVAAIVSGTSSVQALKSAIDALYSKTVYATTVTKTQAGVNGTAHVQGTAFSRGDWGTKNSGIALGGELGQELVVRDGKWFTIGDDSAEFFKYKKGDIIFNAEQTREIFEKGKITHGSGRGIALADGTAFSNGSGKFYGSGSSSSKKENSSDSKKSDSDEFEEKFDWIEIAIDRIERAISSLDATANNIYKSWIKRNNSLKKEMSKIRDEISLQEDAYERYIQEADSVGLDEEYAQKVRNGDIDIENITDEDLAEKIDQYQEWYDKALDCKDAIDELNESLSECYQLAFDNIVTQYDGILSVIEHEKNMLDEYIAQSESKGYITSVKYYEALMKTEQSNIEQLEKEKSALLTSLQEAVESGTIEKGSEAWYEMVNQIDEVTLSIEEANTAMVEYSNSIRDIQWELFDLLQEKLSEITQEADFLINLLNNDKLYNDSGQLTDEGMSTMGLHGMNYNVYMEQADKYAQEILNIDKQLAKAPYNQDLVERRQELLELQQEMILAAEDEKEAIADMVREGIELELESLQELIDTYTEALDAQKDLYDYQKKVKEQSEKISSLEKQKLAYEGDDSEETRAKIQEIKVSLEEAKEDLEETEYDKYISDQKKLLDELYTEYETILNMRLDNIDALIADMILQINTNSSTINATISEKADSVGYTLSETMKTTWDTASGNITNVITTYGSGIQTSIDSASTTLGISLEKINNNIQNMISRTNTNANTNVSSASNSSASYSSQASDSSSYSSTDKSSSSSKSSAKSDSSSSGSNSGSGSNSSSSKSNSGSSKKTSSNSKSNTSNKSTSSSNSSSNKNGYIFDDKKDSYPKSQLDTETSVVDRLKYSDYDSSFSARSNYYNDMGFSGTYTGSFKQNTQMLNWMKKNGYKNGHYKLSRDELAWTQEGRKMEAIIRPSDGAILTPLAQDDSILKASATSNIFNFANDPSGFIRDNLNIRNPVSDTLTKNSIGNTFDNDFSFKIELPNVTNYEEFKYAMQHDKGFESMVRAMTVDKMFGGSSLKKYKC